MRRSACFLLWIFATGCTEPVLQVCGEFVCPIDMICVAGRCATPNVVCGNGMVEPDFGEMCDDGNAVDLDGCSADCRSDELCGNGVHDPKKGESCDPGNGEVAGCRSDCTLPVCGDDVIDPPVETCDEGADNSTLPDAACRPNCQDRRCGDGVVDSDEVCDDGNVSSGDGCSGDCRSFESCGNGIVDLAAGEMCDDGNTVAGDGCAANCRSTEVCRNGVIDAGEVCDDGNTIDDDGCSADCRSTNVCGNSIVDSSVGEMCDAGPLNSNAANAECRTNCRLPRCGDGVVDATSLGEACDAGAANSNAANAACRLNCQAQRCGDGAIDSAAGEVCDDANLASGDGCSGDCLSQEYCGNGIADYALGEECDFGPLQSGDSCSSLCKQEVSYWGNWETNTYWVGEGSAAAYDSTRAQLVTFGGFDYDGLSSNTRMWDGRNWVLQRVGAAHTPPARHYHAMAHDPVRQRLVMFGGQQGQRLQDTWEWNGVLWENRTAAVITATNTPSARTYHTMAWDGFRVMLYGGYDGDPLGDTWFWNGTTWTQKTPAGSDPAARMGAAAVKRSGNEVIMFGGATAGGLSNDTWRWSASVSGGTWSLLATGATRPRTRVNGAMAFDSQRNQVVLFGGSYDYFWGSTGSNDVWELNGTTWTPLRADGGAQPTPPRQWYSAFAYDAVTQQSIVAHGGYTDESWAWNGTTWTQVATRTSPGGYADFTNDSRRNVVLAFNLSTPRDVFEWNGQSWQDRSVSATQLAPAARLNTTRSSHAYDDVSGEVYFYGGEQGSVVYDDLWAWNGSTWQLKMPATATRPPRLVAGVAGYDPRNRRLVLHGGWEPTTGVSNTTYLWNSATNTWTVAATNGPVRFHASLAYDHTHGYMLLFGGLRNYGDAADDTWSWNGTSWTERNSGPGAVVPPDRGHKVFVYDWARRRIVMAGGLGSNSRTDTWLWTGTTWQELFPILRFVADETGSAYDPRSQQILVNPGDAFVTSNDANPKDECFDSSIDSDSDGAFGCADPDCAGYCDPMCPPGATDCLAARPICGDSTCTPPTESYLMCAECPAP